MNPIKILFQDEHYIAVEKPSGVFVHPMNKKGLEDEYNLLKRVRLQTGQYLHPVNRIDRPVSGIVLFALSKDATRKMQDIWKAPSTEKHYITMCKGLVEEDGEFTFALKDENGVQKDSLTKYWPIITFDDCTLLKVQIFSGRKHQIRRHFSRRCFNIIGDTAYGKGKINHHFRDHYDLQRIFLHSARLEFDHPFTGERIKLKSDLPEGLSLPLKKMFKDYYPLLS